MIKVLARGGVVAVAMSLVLGALFLVLDDNAPVTDLPTALTLAGFAGAFAAGSEVRTRRRVRALKSGRQGAYPSDRDDGV